MSSKFVRVCGLVTLMTANACVAATSTEPDSTLSAGTSPSPHRDAAFIVDISTLRRKVAVSAPSGGRTILTETGLGAHSDARAHMSLLGGDAVELVASNYSAGVLGATAPGKVLVSFDLTIINRLQSVGLITPTFPTPPANVTGIQAFPIEVVALTTSGGVSVTGGSIIVTSPRSGVAVPSTDWDGAPHSFFNDVGCHTLSNDCFRYEPFDALEPLAASKPRRVGFLVDPTVGDLRVRIIVAADLRVSTR